jgi:copper resistance protein B
MSRLATAYLIALTMVGGPALAQPMDHSNMPGMKMPASPSKPAEKAKPKPKPKGKASQAPAQVPATSSKKQSGDPHAGHAMPEEARAPQAAPPVDPHAGHNMPAAPGPAIENAGAAAPADPHAGHSMAAPEASIATQSEIPKTPGPPAPTDHAADRFYPGVAMGRARAQLQREHGAVRSSKFIANLAEYQVRRGKDGYRWDAQAWVGDDIHRLVFKSEGEGASGERPESAELQALYSRAVGVYTDLQVGVRHDFEPRDRTYLAVGFQTMFPYWFDVEGTAFLSQEGELLGRVEGAYDLRLTNRLILQPRAELNLAAQDTPETRTGSGLSNAELGLRLRYEVRREFAPYIGVSWDRRYGKTADYARALGQDTKAANFVVGVRAFF